MNNDQRRLTSALEAEEERFVFTRFDDVECRQLDREARGRRAEQSASPAPPCAHWLGESGASWLTRQHELPPA
jgi:hypothetical protein